MSTPNSTIKFYKVPALSPNYRDTFFFSDKTAQSNYFDGTTNVKELSGSQYTRITNNQVKVPYPHSEMLEYNYMLIKNARWGENDSNTGKNYYCFITACEYVSDFCSLITFEVDVMQTYFVGGSYSDIKEAFVERCHSTSDNLFENREPEPFTIQNYTVDEQLKDSIDCKVVIGIIQGTDYKYAHSTQTFTAEAYNYLDNEIYCGGQYFAFDIDGGTERDDLQAFLDQIISDGNEEKIIDFYVVPSTFTLSSSARAIVNEGGGSRTIDASSLRPTTSTTLSGHTVENKKLYNYPFTKLNVVASNGSNMELLFEEFIDGTNIKFKERGCWYGGGEALLQALDYSTSTGVSEHYGIGLIINDFPKCSWVGNNFAQWSNQKLTGSLMRIGSNAVSGAVGSALTSTVSPVIGGLQAVRTVGSAISDVGSLIADGIDAWKKPNPIYNVPNTTSLALAHDFLGWIFQRESLSKAEAEQIDNYFTMFGYAQNKIMNIGTYLTDVMGSGGRPKFAYLKTKGFSMKGSFPSEYKMKINEILDSGITFWKSTATVGDYSSNSLS